MFFRQYDLACLSLYSYVIGDRDSGRAVVVDPQRDIEIYLADAAAEGLRIERVIETHFHADFVSGHLEMADATGAVISYGPGAQADFAIEHLVDGQVLSLGTVELEILHTPGHTPESISIVVRERPGADPWAVLTGDALFIGDVGRPDLLTSIGYGADDLARMLYSSLHDKLLTLPDATGVFPAHGAGSACGKHMSTAASSTIGEQRATNYALADIDVDTFVELITSGQSVAPLYFAFAADENRRERERFETHEPLDEVTFGDAVALAERGAVIVDTRAPESFASGHLRGSINIGLDGRFAEYAGNVIRAGQPVVLVGSPDRASEARLRLARIGFDDVVGIIDDVESALIAEPGFAASAARLTAHDVAQWSTDEPDVQIVDIRGPGEIDETGLVPGAVAVPLPRLLDTIEGLVDDAPRLDPKAPTIVYCAGGYRSSIAASAMRAHGFSRVADLIGGYDAWELATARSV
ncbi:MAG TPA: MBL fold metallo-hydrolase [Acidimicrobiales bacterium]|nr:MBL fold metallo-hydrolase [Acidimicrobiales bacterium]